MTGAGQHWIAFIGYFVMMLLIGVWTTRFSSAGVREYFVGGRSVSRFIVGLSAVASARSAWVFLALVGLAYTQGVSAIWYVVGFTIAEMFLFFFFAPKVRRFSEQTDAITVPDMLAARLGDRLNILRVVIVVTILLFFLPYISAQFVGGGKSLAGAFRLEESYGILITAGVIMIYTFLGGFMAVSITDTIQACFMLFGLITLPVIVIIREGGLVAMLSQLDPGMIDPMKITIGAWIGAVGLGLGSVGNPHITVRYMSIRDPDELRFSAVIATVWCVLMTWGAVFVGLAGRVAFPDKSALPDADPQKVFPVLTETFLHPVLAGMVLAAVFAAIMSTADSQLLVTVSALVRDFYQKTLGGARRLSERGLVLLSRSVVVALVFVAVYLGMGFSGQLHDLIVLAWSGLGASLGPVMLMAFLWKRTTLLGAIGAMIAGVATVLVWTKLELFIDGKQQTLKAAYVDEIVPAFFVALIVGIVVSLISCPPDDAEHMLATMSGKKTPKAPEKAELAA